MSAFSLLMPARGAAQRGHSDRVLLAATLGLIALGLVMVTSASSAVSVDAFGSPYHFLLRHLIYAALGAGLLFAFANLDYRIWNRPTFVYGTVALAILLLVAALLSPSVNGVTRWIRFGPFSFQPSEAAKLALVLYLAYFLHRREGRINDFSATLLPALVVLGQMVLLVALEPDLGASGMLMLIFVGVFFLAGVSWVYIFGCCACFLATLTVYAMSAEYRVTRIMTFLDPQADPLGAGFQVRQSLIAVGTGGISGTNMEGPLGTGLGESVQKLFFLPYPHTDFIFAVIGEELGLLGALLVVLLFTVLLWRGARSAVRAPDRFGALLAAGMTVAIVAQAYLNMAVVLGLVPTKGFPLPLISYGGSSLLCSCIAAGLVLSVSAYGTKKG